MKTALAFLLLVTVAQGENLKSDITYADPAHERQVLDIYSPDGAKDLPVVFWIHGGGWQTGDKKDVQIKPLYIYFEQLHPADALRTDLGRQDRTGVEGRSSIRAARDRGRDEQLQQALRHVLPKPGGTRPRRSAHMTNFVAQQKFHHVIQEDRSSPERTSGSGGP